MVVCLVASGCAVRRSDEVRFTGEELADDLGRRVKIDAAPRRIVSLAPNLTEILFAIGSGGEVVGVTSYCDYPPEAVTKEHVGDTLRPNLEKIVALKPDLVLVTTSSQLEGLTREMERLSIPVWVTSPRTVREVIGTIRRIGRVAGRRAEAEGLAAEMEARLARIEQRVGRLPRVRVLYVLQVSPLITVGGGSYIDDLLSTAGGESISGGEAQQYPQFSRESVIARAPEVILFPEYHGNGAIDEEELRRIFGTTPAVRFNRLVRVNPDWTDRPGPRIIDGLEQVAQALHPESP